VEVSILYTKVEVNNIDGRSQISNQRFKIQSRETMSLSVPGLGVLEFANFIIVKHYFTNLIINFFTLSSKKNKFCFGGVYGHFV
jgi:hypothetical protein